VSLGLVSALPVAPSAALTARGTITQDVAGGTELRAINPDPATGVALRAGGLIGDPSVVKTAGPAGSTALTMLQDDPDLKTVAVGDLFRLTFGLPAANYREQPAAQVIDCAGGCSAATSLLPAVAAFPTRVIFVDGDLALDTNTPIGTASVPTMLVVTGDVTVSQPINFNGVIYAGGNMTWDAGAGGGTVSGAVLVGGNYSGSGTAAFTYDRDIVRRIQKGYGSFVRVPGSWMTEI
jgi:hypothetical protein